MASPAEKLPDPEPLPELVEHPGYSSINAWALGIISKEYKLPTLMQDITPWLDAGGQLTDQARQLLNSIKVTIEQQQVNALDLLDSVVARGNALLEERQNNTQKLASKVLQFITGKFPNN